MTEFAINEIVGLAENFSYLSRSGRNVENCRRLYAINTRDDYKFGRIISFDREIAYIAPVNCDCIPSCAAVVGFRWIRKLSPLEQLAAGITNE